MKKYNSYKPSGIEWIGEIPEHWEVKKLKYVSSINDDVLSEKSEDFKIEYVDISSIESTKGIAKKEELNFLDAPSRARRIVKHGDVIVSTVRTYLKAIARIENPGPNLIVSTGFAVIRPNLIHSTYLGYLFYHEYLLGEIISRSVGVSYPAINSSEIGEIAVPIPQKFEQTAIASYLDRKTAEIDELIADKKRLQELYEEEKTAIINEAVTKGIDPHMPMKDSGIEWLGEIPEHWEVKRIRHVAQIFGRIGYRGYKTSDLVQKGKGAITISPSNMKSYSMDFSDCSYLSWEKYEESTEIMISNEDILFVKTGSTYGKASFVDNLTEKATINPQIIVLKEVQCINKLLWYILKSKNIIFQVEGTVVGGTIPTISQAKINNYSFPIPLERDEQRSIVHHIETECSRIDTKIKRTKKLIKLLKEYRTALISEVVTGKVKVV